MKKQITQKEGAAPLPIRFFQIYVRVFWKLCRLGLIAGAGVVLWQAPLPAVPQEYRPCRWLLWQRWRLWR